ncbi:hypothetical protein K461DRAFT_271730 [Myriangium duriaei CBS 260.36]|uniref:Uncharacterized protein n=1 Tax=Myriangium duriaei CBS 260.36 TaxID=1168546 RepID=A0A9P4ITR1_9PEZI|nr:hypothetical protein K461DRAFT_271730 [Myriangium duriaei CBS 260.36]
MKPSSTHLFKNLVSKIHPQVLLSPKESKQFLNALTTSFRHHLDVEHPHEHVSTAPSKTSSPLTLTEKHVASVLTNPLFAHTGPQSTGSSAARHPIEILEASVANGSASLTTVMQCLAAFRSLLHRSSPPGRRKAIEQYKPGTKALQWLWANDLAQSKIFDFDPRLYQSVVGFLLREGRADAVQKWIEAASVDPTLDSERHSPRSMLLSYYVAHEIQRFRKSLEPALTAFMRYVRPDETHRVVYANSAGSQLIDALIVQDGATEADRQAILKFLDSFPRWQESDLDPQTVKISRLKLRYAPFVSIDSALNLAQNLELPQDKAAETHYGEGVVEFLVSLSDTIQKIGSQAQAKAFVSVLRIAETQNDTSDDSLLSRNAQGIVALLLQEFDRLDFSPRQLSVPT